MIHVPITLKDNSNIAKILEPIKVSIPFEHGKIYSTKILTIINNQQQAINAQLNILAYWPDKSIKWVCVQFLFTSNTSNENTLYLTDSISCGDKKQDGITLTQSPDFLKIETQTAIFQLSTASLGVFSLEQPLECNSNQRYYSSTENSLALTDKKGNKYYPIIDSICDTSKENETNAPITLTLLITGFFQKNKTISINKNTATRFEAEITFYYHNSNTKWHFTLHNPQAMANNNGTWDLGNSNSQFFQSFCGFIPCENQRKAAYQIQDELAAKTTSPAWQENNEQLKIFQAGSGGDNWQSNNHINHQGKVPIEFNGYEISTNILQNKSRIKGRATPVIYVEQLDLQLAINISVYIENFWQKFPKSIEVSANNIILGLFPHYATDGFELQPGEKKSDIFYISYDNTQDSLSFASSPSQVTIAADYLISTQAIPFLSITNNETQYDKIINEGLTSSNNFFNKRELIDEFGWRNFGDLYADHETLGMEGNDELISHYNNQYDPLYGFLRQYLLTNNSKWLELANDLADHVKNIDIYHTNLDKAEYNGGLFWHTDHYLPAETASHRTYSKRQVANAYQDHAGGGGPGGQHCYTTGLMLHYYLTGDKTSKQAVLQLSRWITNYYEGSGTLTDFLLSIKNKKRIDIKSVFTGKYPLDRGTGHYIITLIDAFELTGKQSYLDDASLIIKNTVHPKDNIEERHLDNIEMCWFYTVFFQAVYRYLFTKQNNKQLDVSFNYALNSLLHYANWMSEHEKPYLNTPEALEYPNHTWAAQDIRKANVLYMASYFTHDQVIKNKFKTKADELYHYVINTFDQEPTRSFTRILSILMQNHGIKSFVDNALIDTFPEKTPQNHITDNVKRSQKKNLLSAFFTTLSNTSALNELTWLRRRSSSINNFFIKLGK